MQQPTQQLASAQLGHDRITVELAGDSVTIVWPTQPTVLTPARFPDAAATLTRLFSNAAMELSRIKAAEKR